MKVRVLAPARLEAVAAAHRYNVRRSTLGDALYFDYLAALQKIEADPQQFSLLETFPSGAAC